jgi:hypothetical protein
LSIVALHSKKGRSAAYEHSVRHYKVGTPSADTIQEFLLSAFEEVEGATRLYLYDAGGFYGHMAPRVDRNGLLVFVVYPKERGVTKLQFRRRKKYRRAQRAIFLTAPEVWAHLQGSKGHLRKEHYRPWKRWLERKLGLDDLDSKYPLPALFDPEYVDEEEPELNLELAARQWFHFEQFLGKRLTSPYRNLMYSVWSFFLDLWRKTATMTSTGLPRAIRAADGYVAQKLGVSSRFSVRRAINDLDRLGYLQAAMYERSSIGKRGIYWYLPGTGTPSNAPTRHPRITARDALACIRRFVHGRRWDWCQRPYLGSASARSKRRASK